MIVGDFRSTVTNFIFFCPFLNKNSTQINRTQSDMLKMQNKLDQSQNEIERLNIELGMPLD